MNKYAEVAINSVNRIKLNPNLDPVTSWNLESSIIFGERTSSYNKGCPKSTFLGLCEAGFVRGIPKGVYTNSILNKEYALKAIECLKHNNNDISPTKLWSAIGMTSKSHNQQMNVILELFKHYMLNV